MKERLKVAKLETDTTFIKKKRDAECLLHALKVGEQFTKVQGRAKVLEGEGNSISVMVHRS